EPLPYRRQRRAPDLAGADREIAVNEERLQWPEQQPGWIIGTPPVVVVVLCAAHDLAQLLEHEGRNDGVFAPLQRALELPHQQRLRLRRQLCEVFPQTLGRSLAHTAVMACPCG